MDSEQRKFEGLFDQLRSHGYVEFVAALPETLEFAQSLGRVGRMQEITPKPREVARGDTLSAVYGLEAFPWHTDGAVADRPPRYLLLRSVVDSETPTELLDLELNPEIAHALRRTVLRVRFSGQRYRYVMAASVGREITCFRWDPRSCSPVVNIEESAVALLASAQPSCVVRWVPNRVVIFDNWRIFHRRPRVEDCEPAKRQLQRLYIYQTGR
jgi:alpha-ketoglutarate-dependent taurine dioxygenase